MIVPPFSALLSRPTVHVDAHHRPADLPICRIDEREELLVLVSRPYVLLPRALVEFAMAFVVVIEALGRRRRLHRLVGLRLDIDAQRSHGDMLKGGHRLWCGRGEVDERVRVGDCEGVR